MTPLEIINIVNGVTGMDVVGHFGKPSTPVTVARYTAILMMHEEGYKPSVMAIALECERSIPYKALDSINALLAPGTPTKISAAFKSAYLSCIAKVAEMEDAA